MKSGGSPLTTSPVIGLILSFIAVLLAFFPAGAGEGWSAPLMVSLALPLIYPVAMIRSSGRSREGLPWDVALVALAISADIYLCMDLAHYAQEWLPKAREVLPGVDRSVFPIFLIWLALWLHWQFLAVRAVLRRTARRAG